MGMLKRSARPDPEGWYKMQHSGRDLPHEVLWPNDTCTRCGYVGQMHFSTGRALCQECDGRSLVQVAPAVGLHERRQLPELQS